jgi:hypothetical protein
MTADPVYRTPIRALRRFTDCDIELRLEGDGAASCEPADLSAAVTKWIGTRFAGDREAAERAALRAVARALGVGDQAGWREPERGAFRALALLLAQIPGLERWPAADRRALVALIRAKGGDEFRFHAALQRSARLCAALTALTSGKGRVPRAAVGRSGSSRGV